MSKPQAAITRGIQVSPLVLFAAASALAAAVLWPHAGEWLAQVKSLYQSSLPATIHRYLWIARHAYLNPWSYPIVLMVFVLERVIPARASQRVFSTGLAHDFIWFNADALVRMAWLPLFVGTLHELYNAHLGFLTVPLLPSMPVPARAVAALVLYDFLQYLHHVIRHRVQVFWYFHMIHHSQRQMNFFTDARIHVVEHLIVETFSFIPIFALHANPFTVFGIALVYRWYARVYHANLRTNLGPLKYVLVTPQSHRIHHSIERKHWDKNFGVLFTCWDRLFGTLYPKYDEYPQTGVEDERLPLEQAAGAASLAGAFLAQQLFPFRMIGRMAWRPSA